jgi:disulfide oxidoreductase YuzD
MKTHFKKKYSTKYFHVQYIAKDETTIKKNLEKYKAEFCDAIPVTASFDSK